MSLVVTEMRRGLARRSTRVLLALAIALTVLLAIGIFLDSRAEVDPSAQRAAALAERNHYIDDCVGSGGFGGEVGGRSPQELRSACAATAGPVEEFVKDRRFELTELWRHDTDEGVHEGILGGTALVLVIGALMAGASFIGGDWRHGTIATQLTWEPRRWRVFVSKAVAVAGVSLVIGFLLQAFVSASLLPSAVWRGTTDGADSEWFVNFLGALVRTSALGAGAALIGYAIAMLGRNTAAGIGAAFGYFAVLEPILRGVKPEWQRWMIGDNSTVVLFGEQLDSAPFERTLIEASLLLGIYLIAVLGVSAISFARRDVST